MVCVVTQSLVKALRFVDADKSTMDYLHEAKDSAKEPFHRYYDDKGDEGFE